jgi:aminoglycoside/choline kinase family phosphotransferase
MGAPMQDALLEQTFSRFPQLNGQRIEVQPLEKGGSDRKFYRIAVGDGTSLIVARYGRQREENVHYVEIARFLRQVGVRVPEIYFHDASEGLIWMEDLGERDLWSYRHEPWPVRRALYQSALDELLKLHMQAHLNHDGESPKLQAEFNAELYRWEQNYFFENCLGRYFGLDSATLSEECDRPALDAIAESLAARHRVFVHRDFQSQNIVIKNERACFIDFQGMRPGLAQYDLASLLWDPYVALTQRERDELLGYYMSSFDNIGLELACDFKRVFDLCAMQRLMQALGAYGFLGLVKDREDFLGHIPAALAHLRLVLARIPELVGLRALLEKLEPKTH